MFSYYFYWELELLKEIGYGLELSKCAVSHATEELSYISPKTGHVVTKAVGKPYHEKLFYIEQSIIKRDMLKDNELINLEKINLFFLRKASHEMLNKDITKARQLLSASLV